MTLVTPFTVGHLQCHAIEAGRQHLDGGAMFGVVPRPLWTRHATPDERNRIPLALRCLLVDHPEGLVLVDTGMGNKDDARFREIYGVVNAGTRGATMLEDGLAELGVDPRDIRWVINTHLHFDHAGGNTVLVDRRVVLAFPEATYLVQRGELDYARHTNERTRASYLPPNFEPIAEAGRWQLVEGDTELLPGITSRVTPGHVPWHQCVVLSSAGETAVFVADLIATTAHLPLAWIMGYDVEPLRTLESKRSLLNDAVAGGWRLLFEHDPGVVSGMVRAGPKGAVLEDLVAAPGWSG